MPDGFEFASVSACVTAAADFFPGKRRGGGGGKNRYLWMETSQFGKCEPKLLPGKREQTSMGVFSCPAIVERIERPNATACLSGIMGGRVAIGRSPKRRHPLSPMTSLHPFFLVLLSAKSLGSIGHWSPSIFHRKA